MADYPILTSPDGSTSINVGSVMLAAGVDYGFAAMYANALGGNPMIDGGNLGARWSPPRKFTFPLRVATLGALTPAGVTRALRQMAQNGAVIDLMIANGVGGQVATSSAVRFDVIDGRVRETQDVQMWQQAARREAVLELDVQPYGYLPTWITLASVPSIALPGTIAIPGGSIIGDVPGLAQIIVQSILPSQILGAGVGTYGYDSFFYSLGNKLPAFIPPASMTYAGVAGFGVNATLTGDSAAPASQVQRVFLSPSSNALYAIQQGWQPLLLANLAPNYFGRYRLHAFGRMIVPSYGGAIQIAGEVAMVGGLNPTSFASGGLIASVGQPLTLASDGAYVPMPTGFGFFPLGDITVPTTVASLSSTWGYRVRLWGNIPSLGVPTVTLDIGGLWMQSLDGGQGIITRDLQNNNAGAAASMYAMFPFTIDAYQRDVQAAQGVANYTASVLPALWSASQIPAFSLLDRYRGVLPQLSPSAASIELMLGARRLQTTYRSEVLADTPKVWWRFNEPSGASVILDWSGNGINGLASNLVLGASSLLIGEPGGATAASGFGVGTGAAIPNANAPRTLEAWYQPATYTAAQVIAVMGASEVAAQSFGLQLAPTSVNVFSLSQNASWAYAWKPGLTYHLAAAYNGTNVTFYVNGQALATTTFTAAIANTAALVVGNTAISTPNAAKGAIDEVAVYPSALSAARILAHYIAGRNTMGGTSAPLYHQGGYAGVSIRYQPRFSFSKEI